MIDFYDVSNLHTKLHSSLVAPDYPGRMCPSSPGILVYASCRPGRQVVRWLDCSSFPPTYKDVRTNIQVQFTSNQFIGDMCLITHGKKDLLVTTHSHAGVHAYIAGTDELVWHVSSTINGYLPGSMNAVGVTTNGRGQLFVCDTNNSCIQMLSRNGTFLGSVLSSGDRGLGNPMRVRWCRKRESLVVAHPYEKRGLYSISTFRVLTVLTLKKGPNYLQM